MLPSVLHNEFKHGPYIFFAEDMSNSLRNTLHVEIEVYSPSDSLDFLAVHMSLSRGVSVDFYITDDLHVVVLPFYFCSEV